MQIRFENTDKSILPFVITGPVHACDLKHKEEIQLFKGLLKTDAGTRYTLFNNGHSHRTDDGKLIATPKEDPDFEVIASKILEGQSAQFAELIALLIALEYRPAEPTATFNNSEYIYLSVHIHLPIWALYDEYITTKGRKPKHSEL